MLCMLWVTYVHLAREGASPNVVCVICGRQMTPGVKITKEEKRKDSFIHPLMDDDVPLARLV